jgi:hypothetical protein
MAAGLNRLRRGAAHGVFTLALLAFAPAAWSQAIQGVVVDQTDLPLPGVTIQILDGQRVVITLLTDADGRFSIDPALAGDTVSASLEGFETARVDRAAATRIVLAIAHASESTTVVAPAVVESSPTAALLGTTLAASTVARMPSSHMKARESLPLLPSVIRGPDGLMQLGGARAYQTPLTLDGFNITDPATGISSLNLPFEAVQGIDALRDPMAVTYGGLVGGLVKMESKPGGEKLAAGVQGFVPRPRLSSPGFGRLEGVFPRAFVSGSAGAVRYVAAAEWDYERIPVPEVTETSGSDLVEQSAVVFTRLDAPLTPRNTLTFEAFASPTSTASFGLSPRREPSATIDVSARDLFAGVTHRFVSDHAGLFTIQGGILTRNADGTPQGEQGAQLSPLGWSGNWFADVHRSATRYTAAVTWERLATIGKRSHDFTVALEAGARTLTGRVAERPVQIVNITGQTLRSIDFGAPAAFSAQDRPVGLAVRDVWQATARTQLDGGVRADYSSYGGGAPSARIGLRQALDSAQLTVIKAGVGTFVGSQPLMVPAFGAYPIRRDRRFNPVTGAVVSDLLLRPAVGRLRLPRAITAVIGLERQIAAGLAAQVMVTSRRTSRVAVLRVPSESGDLVVDSSGSGSYRELQVSMRRTWSHDQQLFVSYVRSSSLGELNDFAALFQNMDVALLQPGGMARRPTDAQNRVLSWGTFDLPGRVVVSPVVEWRSGFPYATLNGMYQYEGPPNTHEFPAFMSADLVIYKTFTVRNRSADVGFQLFNATDHQNPRDVYPVLGSPRAGEFTNSVGPIFRGYMLLKW